MTPLAAYLLLFVAVGTGFIFVHLVAGKLIRPSKPHSEKGTTYECGEPTIGSAWIQFDLRFYVVALLFVIFDVEVAFFFPWAEVFGKANAISNAPDPKTAAEFNDFGEKILDLSIQSNAPVGVTNQRRWEKMRTLTDDELKAYQSFSSSPGLTRYFRSMTAEQFDLVVRLTPEQRGQIKQTAATLRAAFDAQVKEREPAMAPFEEAAKKPNKAVGNIPALIEAERANDQQFFNNATLGDIAVGKLSLMMFARPPTAGTPERPRPMYLAARELDPAALGEALALANRQVDAMKVLATDALASLRKMGPGREALWIVMTPLLMKELDAMTDEQVVALSQISFDGIMMLYDPRNSGVPTSVMTVKEDARSLAWLALGEILVFFGVLLVGFAYLWKRGDLAWVRATIAEQGQYPLAPPPTILPVMRPLETASAGDHSGS